MTTHDDTTGLLNAASFEKLLDCEWKMAQRNGTPISIALVEIDRLASFREEHGRYAADECMRFVASAMSSHFPNVGAAVAHLGDGLFAALLPLTDLSTARLVADASAGAIGRVPVEYAGAKCARVTASTGVAAADRDSGYLLGPAAMRFQAEASLRLTRATQVESKRRTSSTGGLDSQPLVA